MKKIIIVLICFFASLLMNAQEKYSKTKIFLSKNNTLEKLIELGFEVDHGFYEKNKSFTSDISIKDIEILKNNHVQYEILIDDVSKYYVERNKTSSNTIPAYYKTRAGSCKPSSPTFITPTGFNFGSMGGYFTYQEAINKIDSLAILYPNIVSIKKPIGNYTTQEGDSIFWLKISDNPNINENEPQILYDAVHHAREPLSLSQLIYYMYYLCENYATNPEIKYLVDNIEMYFVPIVNPDGYKYNQLTDPNGGGMWRKNRRDNLDATFGVDINRNYGTGWGYNNIGSSPSTSSYTYRGIAAFSEPEIQAMRDFCNAHQFRFAMNYHTYSNLIVYPWGYLSKNCDDSIMYREVSSQLTKYNFYKYGTDMETVGYSTNGSSDDWMYGDIISKPLIYAMTPEVGDDNDGFWPMISRIIPLCTESNYMNIMIAKYVLKYAVVENQTPRLTDNTNGFIKYNIKRLGLETPATYTVSLQALNPLVTNVGANNSYSSLTMASPFLDSISYTLQSGIANNTELKFLLSVSNGQFTNSDTVSILYGNVQNILTDNCSTFSNWTNNGWALDNTTSSSSSTSFAENSSGIYPSNYLATLQNAQAFDLTNADRAEITYKAKWEMENSLDYVQLSVSENNGITWSELCAPHTQITSNTLLGNEEVYTGVVSDWIYEIINLDNYIGKNITIKWTFSSDGGFEEQGFNIDDIVVNKLVKAGVGIQGVSQTNFQITPNPANTIMSISLSEKMNTPLEINITNTMGQNVYSTTTIPNSTTYLVDLQKFSSGIYFVKTNYNGKSQLQKLLIEK